MNEALKIQITVEADNVGTSSRQAQALHRILLDEGLPAVIERIRLGHETLDGGATLAVVLASPVLFELARTLRIFLQRYHSSRIRITDEHGSVIVEEVSEATIAKVLREWAERRNVG